MRAAVLLGAVALLALACAPRAVATEQGAVLSMQAPLRMDDGIRAQLEVFPGASKWAALKHMFTAASVRVRCPGHKASPQLPPPPAAPTPAPARPALALTAPPRRRRTSSCTPGAT
jgi:hypothetical protein